MTAQAHQRDAVPEVLVVVPTHDRAALLPRLVTALREQLDAPPFRVVVVDDASSDDTSAVLARLRSSGDSDTITIRLDHNAGPATARNRGWRSEPAQWIAFTDDDCVPDPRWLGNLLHDSADLDVVQGRTIPDADQLARAGPFSRTMDVSAPDGYFQTCNVAYRRTVLEALGGFDESFRFPAGEDTDLAWRAREAGHRIGWRPEAVVRHDVRPSQLAVALRDGWRWQSVPLAARRHPELRSLFHSRWIWRRSHQAAALACTGLLVLAVSSRPRARLLGTALLAPYIRFRIAVAPLPTAGPRRRWLLLPAALLVDTTEVAACLIGSVRHRSFVL